MDIPTEVTDAVYGRLYASARTQMELTETAIQERKGKGFQSDKECAEWAKEHMLDILVVAKSQKRFFHMSHRGDMLLPSEWTHYYCDDVLFVWEQTDKGEYTSKRWYPSGYDYHNKAKIVGELSDGSREPIFHRDYSVPTGYYDHITGSFNSAVPFPCFAKETGRDTSHIYTYIENVAGVCAPHLLAWLRQKLLYPKKKTEVIPIFTSRAQGTGKSSFGEVICKGLFGEKNVLVTDQYDASARFNSDNADALVVSVEEKKEDDTKNTIETFKSRATATTIRKENKGLDPVYQASYTEYVISTNKDVAMKFDTMDQRRFMVMGGNPEFKVDTNDLADEVFGKLYGRSNKTGKEYGTPFVNDLDLISQFKHELVTRKDIAEVNYKQFPKTAEFQRNFSLPRTNENVEIDAITRTLAPFILESLRQKSIVTQVLAEDGTTMLALSNFITSPASLQYVPAYGTFPAFVAVCRPLVYYDQQTSKPFNHATVERGLLDCAGWLLADYGMLVHPNQMPLPGGFMHVMSRYRQAPAARFILAEDKKQHTQIMAQPEPKAEIRTEKVVENRTGERLRVNSLWKPDPDGEFETVNEMKPGVTTLENKSANVQYMDTFLFEADDTSQTIYALEKTRLYGSKTKDATSVFMERLRMQKAESDRLLNEGIAFRVVYSGGKSYHILVRVKDAPRTLDEYKWLHAHLCASGAISEKLNFDPACNDPARLTRAPVLNVRTFTYQTATIQGTQNLYRELPGQIFDYAWRPAYEQWLNRPPEAFERNGKKMRPTKPEYKEAMLALLHGTFWTDHSWNGRRQTCFFPAYRLCRLLGFTHDELWTYSGILDGLEKYYRKKEIDYWQTRESCDLVKTIDKEAEAQLAEELAAIEKGEQ